MLEIGSTLREARIRRGLDMARCEMDTRIRGKYLQALEGEHFDSIPAPVYVKSFLRTYAEYLELDATLLIDEYTSRFEAEPEMVEHRVRQIPARRRRAPHLPGGQLAWVALGGVGAVLLLVWVGAGGGGRTAVPLPPTRTTPPPSEVVAPPAPPPPATRRVVPQAPARGVVLSVTGVAGTDGSYLEVHRGSITGPAVWVGTVAPDRSRRFRDDTALYVRVGWTPGVTARVNGAAATLDGGTANFRVTRAGAERLP